MKKFLLFFILLVIGNSAMAQQYKSHTVVKGENVYRIAKRYNTTPEAIYKINPTAKDGIQEGQILAIPVVNDEEYKTHVVEKGDTVFSLSQKYNTTQEAIFILNPEAVNGINLGQILRVGKIEKKEQTALDLGSEEGKDAVLDSLKIIPEEQKIIRFITHKVKRKETLYGIAKKYNITVEDIKKQNKRLYSEQIKKKDKIRIPVFAQETTAVAKPTEIDSISPNSRLTTTTRYIVKPKDTRYGIARRHGITITQLEQLNPTMDPDFPIGMEITVPTTIFVSLKDSIQPGFELYEVKPKETIFGILKRTGISSDSLFNMNPYLREGLKAGMVITIPKDTMAATIPQIGKYLDLGSKLYNFKPKKVAVMLPFSLDTLNFEVIQETEEHLKKKQSLRIALDLYSGILIAVDSAKTKGITTELNVFDTKKNNNTQHIRKILKDHDFEGTDAVIGPLYQNNLETVAAELRKYETPIFSPASRKESNLYDNFFQTRPTNEMLQERIISYVEKDSTDKNIIIIVQQGKKYEEIKEKLKAKFPEAKVAKIEEGNYLYEVHLGKVLVENKPNWVFLESNDVAMLSNVIPLLNAKAESHKITLFTSDKNSAFDDDSVKNEHLSKLHLHYPSFYKEFDEEDEEGNKHVTPFTKKYKAIYGSDPNNWAVRGFDIAYDILMRLGSADDMYHAVSFEGTTQYVENKFNYTKKMLGGYCNDATYIIKFDNDLKLTLID
ncbi:LysM peptidoglycan-binding domain-containing protein [Aquimarina gracilis]|uniref:LysM peptidoglycan-binding domain-containing protein n=1 Tax=Aquimarina gracilis TaxID=874422 RepID=A0ABU5ZQX3_9FLAO|nr:LysM peptidoglycan-binding domain-containing protein [Aquimarina gracilis]MEB3344471.1 LysM peptidoglycan-binding domain-containing protein [Aquimarina gracilis]